MEYIYLYTISLFGYSYDFNVSFVLAMGVLSLLLAVRQREFTRALTKRHLEMVITARWKQLIAEQVLMVGSLVALFAFYSLECISLCIIFFPVMERIQMDTLKGQCDAREFLRDKYLVNIK